ncbi:smoothelin-like protein 1 [Phalacrocorax carbo]|uniref:smoothelin-like protein 1 n=1 Tax=Phalacrocorax carbo TaxID=9209 RepID=UPI003119E552
MGGEDKGAEDTGSDTKGAGDMGGDTKGAGDTGGDTKGAGDVVGEDKDAGVTGGDTKGAGHVGGEDKGAGDIGGDTKLGAAEGDAVGDTGSGGGAAAPKGAGSGAKAVEAAGGDAKGTGGAQAEGAGGAAEGPQAAAGPGPAAAGSTLRRQEPAWLQDEEDELWPEFPPCSSPGGATSPTSPLSPTSPVSPMSPESPTSSTADTTEGSEGSKRGTSAGGPQGQAPPRTVGLRPRPEAAWGRPRASARAQGRSAILEKFGGAATGPAPHLKRTGGAATVKAMLLEWCRARTRGYEHVDVQNFSGSWGSGLAFCALIHSFFPDAFDYGSLEPSARRQNLALAFTTAEERAGCAPLLEVDDMVRLPVPDAKCVYTYLQELYRCLVAKGLVKTKKR